MISRTSGDTGERWHRTSLPRPLSSWWKAALWLGLAVAAHRALLSLAAPGQWSYGFRSAADALGEHRPAVAVVVLVALVVVAASRPAVAWLLARFGAARIIGFVMLWTVSSALLARTPGAYLWSLSLTTVGHLATLGAMALAIAAMPVRVRETPTGPLLPWILAVVACVASLVLAFTVFDAIPHIPDDVAYYFQAKTYAAGAAYRPAPPEPSLFRQFLIPIRDGKWFSVFPPGWPLVLALGMRAGVPWLVNPILAGVAVLVVHALMRRTFSRVVADVVAVMVAFSPSFLFASATYMAHTLSIVCAVSVLLCLDVASAAATRRSQVGWAALAGGSGGLLFLTRPIDGVVVGLAAALWRFGNGRERLSLPAVATAGAAACLVASLFVVNNRLLTGNALRDPIQTYFDETYYPGANSLGFGQEKGNMGWDNNIFPGHSPYEAAIHANINSSLVDLELFGSPFGAVFPLVLFVVLTGAPGLRSWRRQGGASSANPPWLNPWLTMVGLTAVATSLYWYSGADLGPRYWLICIGPLALLSVLGVFSAADRFGIDRHRAAALLIVASIVGALQVIPWRAEGKYRAYRGIRTDIRDLRPKLGTNDLVVVRSTNAAVTLNNFAEFGAAVIWNEVPLERSAIFARAVTDEDVERLRATYPGRPTWIIDAPSLTKDHYRIMQSPADGR